MTCAPPKQYNPLGMGMLWSVGSGFLGDLGVLFSIVMSDNVSVEARLRGGSSGLLICEISDRRLVFAGGGLYGGEEGGVEGVLMVVLVSEYMGGTDFLVIRGVEIDWELVLPGGVDVGGGSRCSSSWPSSFIKASRSLSSSSSIVDSVFSHGVRQLSSSSNSSRDGNMSVSVEVIEMTAVILSLLSPIMSVCTLDVVDAALMSSKTNISH